MSDAGRPHHSMQWFVRVGVAIVLLSTAAVMRGSGLVSGDQPSREEILRQIEDLDREFDARCAGLDGTGLKACNAEYRRRFAQIGFVATPHDVESSPEPPFPLPLGIFPDADSWGLYDFDNYWHGMIQGQRVSVLAGTVRGSAADVEDPAYPPKGGIVVIPYGEGPSPFYPTPTPSTSVRIESADGALLTLVSPDGTRFVFDAATRVYLPAGP